MSCVRNGATCVVRKVDQIDEDVTGEIWLANRMIDLTQETKHTRVQTLVRRRHLGGVILLFSHPSRSSRDLG